MRDLLAPLALAYVLSGCAQVQKAEDIAGKVLDHPVIELVLRGGDAELVKAQAAKYNGAVDLEAVTIGTLIVYLTPEAYRIETRRHECEHVAQLRAIGLSYGLRYAIEARTKGYEANVYEVAARARESDEKAPTADTDCR